MTVPDPHAPTPPRVPASRRAAREARDRAELLAAGDPAATEPVLPPHPPESAGADVPEHDHALRSAAVVELLQTTEHPAIFKPRLAPLAPPRQTRRSPARHVRRRRARGLVTLLGGAVAAVLVLGGSAAATSAFLGPAPSATTVIADTASDPPTPLPQINAGAVIGTDPADATADAVGPAVPAGAALCATPAFTGALAAHDDASAISAAGGAQAFRDAVAAGTVPCVSLADPAHVWVVVDKLRPFSPIDYAPSPMTLPAGVRSLEGGTLRRDAAAAMSTMVSAAEAAGVGEIALESGYRSYATQQTSYGNQVSARGVAQADLVSARPGYSEHQSGLAGDVVACDGGCGTLDDLAASPQGAWLVAHSWEYGWIVRYEAGHTAVSGYLPEPWHLRYIGTALAKAYHDGGYHTLEEFFGLPAAPDYAR